MTRNSWDAEICFAATVTLDLFEYLQTGPDENVKIGSETISGTHTIGLTASSRIWRLTFERPFAVRMRDQNLKSKHQTEKNFPGRCCFSEQSEWINEFVFEQRLGLVHSYSLRFRFDRQFN